MSSGRPRPGLASGYSVPEYATGRGDDPSTDMKIPDELPEPGFWEPQREAVHLRHEDRTRTRLAYWIIGLLGIFMLVGLVAITCLILTGRETTPVSDYMQFMATPLFGVVMLMLGYYFGQAKKRKY
jgi:hypothetical protein